MGRFMDVVYGSIMGKGEVKHWLFSLLGLTVSSFYPITMVGYVVR